jgi:tetratricopeptide (TPR) repeat protein
VAAVLVVAAGLAAYANSFHGPFIFDDIQSIKENTTIADLRQIGRVLSPPLFSTTAGRPLLNLTLAINYAIGGQDVVGYHALNLAIHLLAALTLMGVVRRTLLSPRLRDRYGAAALPLAAAVALIWALHPLQTESVTYLIQRAEALAGLFYLLTLYGAIRGSGAARGWRWYLFAAASCLLGVASKEVVVTAPLVVLLYDRTFLGGSFREAWRRRWGLYVLLASSWLLGAFLVFASRGRGGSAGLASGVSIWRYALTQTSAIPHYLRLTFWPSPLIFDYGTALARNFAAVWPGALLMVLLLAATGIALWRWPIFGFLGIWFFACLAPSSSVVPIATQTIAEHRMYLALAAPVALAIVGAWTLWGKLWRGPPTPRPMLVSALVALAATATALGVATAQRNEDYHSTLSIWQDTLAKRPQSARAHNNFGMALADGRQFDQAIEEFRAALAIEPDYDDASYNLGLAYYDLGNALTGRGQLDQAAIQYQNALALDPNRAEAHNNLGILLARAGRVDEAIEHFRKGVAIKPDNAEIHYDLGRALAMRGQIDQAIAQFEKALELRPDYTNARNQLQAIRARQR